MNWFYTKEITIRKNNNTYDDETGMYSRNETQTITISCDVQPLDTKVDIDEHGKLINAEYKIFCDADNFINDSCLVNYNGKDYKIEKLTDWDDYFILYIRAVV